MLPSLQADHPDDDPGQDRQSHEQWRHTEHRQDPHLDHRRWGADQYQQSDPGEDGVNRAEPGS